MSFVLLAIGLVCVVEGLALALAPSRLEEILARFAAMTRDQRRMIGLGALTIGVVLVWLARWLGV